MTIKDNTNMRAIDPATAAKAHGYALQLDLLTARRATSKEASIADAENAKRW